MQLSSEGEVAHRHSLDRWKNLSIWMAQGSQLRPTSLFPIYENSCGGWLSPFSSALGLLG